MQKNNIEFISVSKKVDYSTKEIKKKYGQKAFSVKVSNKNATYTTSDKKVATVSKNGKVTIKGCGEVIISIKAPVSESKNGLYKKILMRVYPKKISNVSAYSKTKGKLTVKWKANSENVECYGIEISADKNFKRICDNVRVAGNKTSYTLSEKAGKTYYVRVQAIGSNGLDLLDCYTPGLDGEFSKAKKVKVK